MQKYHRIVGEGTKIIEETVVVTEGPTMLTETHLGNLGRLGSIIDQSSGELG